MLSNQSPTLGTDTGKASPLTGITILHTRRKTPLIFNALLSGLKGTGTWKNCAAKCVFLSKAHCIWLCLERNLNKSVCVCFCVCIYLTNKKENSLDFLIRKPHNLNFFFFLFSARWIIFTEPCQLLPSYHRTASGKSLTNPQGVSGDGGITKPDNIAVSLAGSGWRGTYWVRQG